MKTCKYPLQVQAVLNAMACLKQHPMYADDFSCAIYSMHNFN